MKVQTTQDQMDFEERDKLAKKFTPNPCHDPKFSCKVEHYKDGTSSEFHYHNEEEFLEKKKLEFKAQLTHLENQMDTMLRTFNLTN